MSDLWAKVDLGVITLQSAWNGSSWSAVNDQANSLETINGTAYLINIAASITDVYLTSQPQLSGEEAYDAYYTSSGTYYQASYYGGGGRPSNSSQADVNNLNSLIPASVFWYGGAFQPLGGNEISVGFAYATSLNSGNLAWQALVASGVSDTVVLPTGANPAQYISNFNAPLMSQDETGLLALSNFKTATESYTVYYPSYVWVDLGPAPSEALSATGANVSTTEGTSTGLVTVASLTDTDPTALESDFTATINWGDGTSGTGTVTGSDKGGFSVNGSHSYNEEGSYKVSVTIHDTVGGSTATATSTATVADAPLSVTQAKDIAATEGTSTGPVTLATFTDANPNASAGDFTATINWGDGTAETGKVTAQGGGSFSVNADAHTYAEEGSYNVSVAIADVGGSTATATSTATVADAPLSATASSIAATEGTATSATVATFTDSNPGSTAGEFTATIDWGDGTTTPGTVVTQGGGFAVTGTHTYTEEGSYQPVVTIKDAGGSTATTTSTATVADAPLSATASSIAAIQGTATSATVATFTDSNPNSAAGDFTATIDWGDGTTTPGTVAAQNGGGFAVTGVHTYAEKGSYQPVVTIKDAGGSTATATSTATVADAPLSAQGAIVIATEGVSTGNVPVATFTDTDPNAVLSDYTVTITRSDGTSFSGDASTGNIVQLAGDDFIVNDTHTYADEGTYAVNVKIADSGGSTTTATGNVVVKEGDVLTSQSKVIVASPDHAFSGVVATFSDSYQGQKATDFTATIDWGDGTTSTGSVSGGNGTFAVSGLHTYLAANTRAVAVTLSEDAPGTATSTAQSTAHIVNGGHVVKGYISGATVFADANGTGQLAANDVSTTTDSTGSFSLAGGSGPLIAFGGTDTSTGLPFKGQLSAPAGSTDITPLTTLLTDLTSDPSAQQKILSALGLSSTLDLTTLDPIAATQGGSADGAATEVAGAKVYDTVEMIASALAGAGGTFTPSLLAAFSALATTLDGAGISLSDKTALSALITNVAHTENISLGNGVADSVASVIAAGNAALDHVLQTDQPGTQLLSDAAGVELVMQGAASTAITDASGSLTQLQTIANLFGGTNLSELISQGLVVTAAAINGTEGTSVNAAVATFADGNPNATPSDFAATINWGDGTTSVGTVVAQSGLFAVTGTHIYGEEGNYKVGVTINDDGGTTTTTTTTTTATSTATIADASHTILPSSNGVAIGHTLSVSASNGVLANDGDPDDLTVAAVDGHTKAVGHAIEGKYGWLTLNADGSYTYKAGGGDDWRDDHRWDDAFHWSDGAGIKQDVFKYTVSDGHGGLTTSTLSIVVVEPGATYLSGADTTLTAGRGLYVLDGSAGGDTLKAGHGHDVLIGGNGDSLVAGHGQDTFLFRPGFGTNTISNFNVHDDTLQFDHSIFSSLHDILAHTTNTAAGAVISDGHGDTVTLLGIKAAQLHMHQDDFHLV